MAKFCGNIGFIYEEEEPEDSGIWKSKVVEKRYFGEIKRSSNRWNTSSLTINGELVPTITLSIIADSFAINKIAFMKYVEYYGEKMKIQSIEPHYPRLTIVFGGNYNDR